MFGKTKKKLRFTKEDIINIFRKKQTQIEAKTGEVFFEKASNTGVVSSSYVEKTVKEILSGSPSSSQDLVFRVSIAEIATQLDLDKQTTAKYVQSVASDLGSDVYYFNETYLTKYAISPLID